MPSLRQLYARLYGSFGPQHWWPARSAFEVMVGAILTQAAAWHNVEQAIERLRGASALNARALAALPLRQLSELIRPAGYFRQKAIRLRIFSRWFVRRFGASPRRMFQQDRWQLRSELQTLHGIGPETADSILLYAGSQPVFVIDAYTRRVLGRHGLARGTESYEQLQRLVMDRLPKDLRLFNEFHALLVAVGKRYCHRRNPDCAACPLGAFPHTLEVIDHG